MYVREELLKCLRGFGVRLPWYGFSNQRLQMVSALLSGPSGPYVGTSRASCILWDPKLVVHVVRKGTTRKLHARFGSQGRLVSRVVRIWGAMSGSGFCDPATVS